MSKEAGTKTKAHESQLSDELLSWTSARRAEFPAVASSSLAYLDSASTAQKSSAVISYAEKHLRALSGGADRSSGGAFLSIDQAREDVGALLNTCAASVVFTRGSTDSARLTFGALYGALRARQRVLVLDGLHHSTQSPLLRLAKELSLDVKSLPLSQGKNPENWKEAIAQEHPQLVVLTHVSNVTGERFPVSEVCRVCREKCIWSVVDGAQSVGHIDVNLDQIGADFYFWSFHKMGGLDGAGGLCLSERARQLSPLLGGGGAVSSFDNLQPEWQSFPRNWEAGSLPLLSIGGAAAASRYLRKLGMQSVERAVLDLSDCLRQLIVQEMGDDVTFLSPQGAGIVTFYLKSVPAHDCSDILLSDGIISRSGQFCSSQTMQSLGISAAVRLSPYIYNTRQDLTRAAHSLRHASQLFS